MHQSTVSKRLLKSIAQSTFARPFVTRRAAALAARMRRSLVLLYHRISPNPGASRIVTPLPVHVFAAQLETLRDVGDIVPVSKLFEQPTAPGRPRFAITFDDDYPEHAQHALPVLQSMDIEATFFLSGRSLHNLGPYWWQVLEHLLERDGLDAVANRLDVRANSALELARTCETRALGAQVERLGTAIAVARLEPAGVRALADAGMEIGFHTLHHAQLTGLSGTELDKALRLGRERLARHTGKPVRYFAYPHGKASAQVRMRTRQAGYDAAFTTSRRAIGWQDDRFSLGRYEPPAVDPDAFRAEVLLRLMR